MTTITEVQPTALPHDIILSEDSLLVNDKKLSKDTLNEYSDDTVFDRSFRVNGGNKQFTPNSEIISLNNPNQKDFAKLIEKSKEFDLSMKIRAINASRDFNLHAITNEYVVLSLKDEHGSTTFYHMNTPHSRAGESVAYSQFCKLVGIPAPFTKKNSAELNTENFVFHLNRIKFSTSSNDSLPVDIVYFDQTQNIIIEKGVGEDVEKVEMLSIPIATFVARRSQADHDELYVPNIQDSIPMLHKVLINLEELIHAVNPSIQVGLQSYATGYDGRNKGLHFVRVILEHPDFKIEANGEDFSVGFNIHMDFVGNSKNSDQVQVAFVNFREICTNGMVATFDDLQIEKWRSEIVASEMAKCDSPEGTTGYNATLKRTQKQFSTALTKEGMSIPIWIANESMEFPVIKPVLEYCLNSDPIEGRLNLLYREFDTDMNERNFLEFLLSRSKSMKFASPKLIKCFCKEYIGGNRRTDISQKFKTPMDVCNFLTYTARSFPTDQMFTIEAQSMELAESLMRRFVDKEEPDTLSEYEWFCREAEQEVIVFED